MGEVTLGGGDFPWWCGQFTLILKPNDEYAELLNRYYEYNLRLDEYEFDSDEYYTFMHDNEVQFLELIESEEWKLKDKDGLAESILIPMFYKDGISIRLN